LKWYVTRGDILRIAPTLHADIELPLQALAAQHGMRFVTRNTRSGERSCSGSSQPQRRRPGVGRMAGNWVSCHAV
jgi:hypothetical protein